MEVAQPAVGFFQVRLEKEGHVSMGSMALFDLGGEHGEPLPGSGPPLVEGLGEHGRRHRGVAGHHPAVEQAQLGPEVVPGDLEDLRGAAHGMVEADALVPHRVPHGVGDATDVPPPVVDEDDVEVAVGAELASPVPTHGDKGDPVGVPVGGPLEQVGQPLVGGGGQGRAEVLTLEVRSLEQLLAQRAERHRRR